MKQDLFISFRYTKPSSSMKPTPSLKRLTDAAQPSQPRKRCKPKAIKSTTSEEKSKTVSSLTRKTNFSSTVEILPASFFQVDALELAPLLLGKFLRRDDVILRITEVEAYRQNDSACHARFGVTARTAPVFGPGGHAYVYLCYGLHVMLNVVADKEGIGAAVLIRSCAPVSGPLSYEIEEDWTLFSSGEVRRPISLFFLLVQGRLAKHLDLPQNGLTILFSIPVV